MCVFEPIPGYNHIIPYHNMFAFRIFFHEQSKMFVDWVPDMPIWKISRVEWLRKMRTEKKRNTKLTKCLWIVNVLLLLSNRAWQQTATVSWYYHRIYSSIHTLLWQSWKMLRVVCFIFAKCWTVAPFPTTSNHRIEEKRCEDFRLFLFEMRIQFRH